MPQDVADGIPPRLLEKIEEFSERNPEPHDLKLILQSLEKSVVVSGSYLAKEKRSGSHGTPQLKIHPTSSDRTLC